MQVCCHNVAIIYTSACFVHLREIFLEKLARLTLPIRIRRYFGKIFIRDSELWSFLLNNSNFQFLIVVKIKCVGGKTELMLRLRVNFIP